MARSNILYDGSFGHVFSRSIEKRAIFEDNDDFKVFKNLLFENKEKGKFQLYHYCLMHTHFHLVVRVGSLDDFSKAMQSIKWRYTRNFNEKNKRWGPLWRERFKSMLIENESYLYACGRYIEQNPVKAGIVGEASQWDHSSAKHYEGREEDRLVEHYGDQKMPQEIDLNDKNEFERGWVIGSGWFKFKTKKGWVSLKR